MTELRPDAGDLEGFLGALVRLEESIDPGNITVTPFEVSSPTPPHIFNMILPSKMDKPTTQETGKAVNFGVYVVIPTADVADEQIAWVRYWDRVSCVLERDLVFPHQSVLRAAAHYVDPISFRGLEMTYDSIKYRGIEFVITAHFRSAFSPS